MATILIIDDDIQVRQLFGIALMRAGFDVLEAGDGEIGMKLFNEQHVDLVITDIVMPEKEGLETILDMRRINPATKIIAISGGGQMSPLTYLTFARDFGAACAFMKPVDLDRLIEKVRELIAETPE